MSGHRHDIPAFLTTALVAVAMLCAVAFLSTSDTDFILPPFDWLSWGVNAILLLITGFASLVINKQQNLVRGNSSFTLLIFLPLTACIPAISSGLNIPVVTAVLSIFTLAEIWNSIDKKNGTVQAFLVAAATTTTALFDIHCALMLIPYFLGGIAVKIIGFRETCAYIMGIIAPPLCAIAFGLSDISQIPFDTLFKVIELPHIFNPLLMQLAVVIAVALCFIIMILAQAVNIYYSNAHTRNLFSAIQTLGACSLIFMAIDSSAFLTFLPTLNLCVAFMAARMLTDAKAYSVWITAAFTIVFSSSIFILSIILQQQ